MSLKTLLKILNPQLPNGVSSLPIKSQISLQMNDGFQCLSGIQCDPIDGMGQTPQKCQETFESGQKVLKHTTATEPTS